MAYWQALHVYMVIKVGEKVADERMLLHGESSHGPNNKQVCISTTWWRGNKGWVGLCGGEAAAGGIAGSPSWSLHKFLHLMIAVQ